MSNHAPSLPQRSDTFVKYAQGLQTLPKTKLPLITKLFALPHYHWLLLCVCSTLCVHVVFAPRWLMALGIISVLMQLPSVKAWMTAWLSRHALGVYRALQLGCVFGGLITAWISFGGSFNADFSVTFLVLCLVGKLWELHSRRDALVVLNLSLFVLAAAFLWTQSPSMTLAVFVSLLFVLSAFISLHDDDNAQGTGRARVLMLLVLPSIPMLVVLFLLFPRIPPLWQLNLAPKQATTGISDSMSPGDFANLSQSTELAFRVLFDEQLPSREQLYWRGMVFSDFDGHTWRPNTSATSLWHSSQSARPAWADAVSQPSADTYQVLLEPTHQSWLFALDYPSIPEQKGLGLTSEFNLRSDTPIDQQRRYTVYHHPQARIDRVLSDELRAINLALPKTSNPQARTFAQRLYAETGGDPLRFIAAIEAYVHDQAFYYTLSPPTLGAQRIDEFWFGTRAGFCEHYASSFVFLMRAAGVPARVVAGYQGGERGRDGTSWEVRQMDAHAWAEVWVDDHGWLRVDPTAFIAPNRIERGMDALTASVGSAMFGDGVAAQLDYHQFRLLQNLRRYSDQMSYYWQRDVVGFDHVSQRHSLFKWFGLRSLTAQIVWMLAGFLGILTLVVLLFWYKNRRVVHPLDASFFWLSAHLARIDVTLARSASEPVLSWLGRLDAHLNDERAHHQLRQLIEHYRNARFGQAPTNTHKQSADPQAVKALKTGTRQLLLAIKTSDKSTPKI